MGTPAVRRSTSTPLPTSIPPAAKAEQTNVKTRSNPLLPDTNAGNQAAYRTLAESQGQRVDSAAPGSTPPATLAGGGRTGPGLPHLSPRVRQEMLDDVEAIVTILKSEYVNEEEEGKINGFVEKYADRDRGLRPPLGETLSPNLDHFLILLKSRAFARSSFKSLGQDQSAIAYDAIWYRLGDKALDEFRNLVARSQTQKTSGPGDKDVENGAALIAKQEAMGMWGMLKGMGTGLVGIAGPEVSMWMGQQFDETANILFGDEWNSAEPLVWGMNAGQIGTVGGDVIWQLVTFARGAGPAKAGKIWALIDNMKKVMAVGAGLQGVYLGGEGMARVIEQRQKAGLPINIESLLESPDFLDALVTMMTSTINTVLAAKGAPASKQQAIDHARLRILINQLHLVAALARASEIAASDRSPEEKEREYGLVAMNVIPQLVSGIFDVHAYQQAKGRPDASPAAPPVKEESRDKAAPKTTPQTPAASEESGELSRKTMNDAAPPPKKTPKYVDETPAAQKLQARLADEAEKGLAPRQAPETPEEVKSGARKAKYEPATTSSKTVGKPVATLDEARSIYDEVIAETGGKYEVGIYHKPDGTYAVRLGQVADVDAPTEWRSIQHYHTNEPDIPLWRMPARADMAEPATRAERTNKPTTEIVEYPLPGGKRGRAAYTVNPDGSMKISFVDAAGKTVDKSFPSVKDYNDYYKTQTVYVDPKSETYKRLIAGPGTPPADADADTSTKTMYGGGKQPPDANTTTPKTAPATTANTAPAAKQEADTFDPNAKPKGDPFNKELGDEFRKDPGGFGQKPNDKEDPIVAARVGGDTKTKGQYWVEGSDEFDAAYEGKGKNKTVKPGFIVLPKSLAEPQFRPAGTPFDPTIEPRKQGAVQLESSGAGRRLSKDSEGEDTGHDITGRARKQADEKRNEDTFLRTVGADVSQAHGYNELLTRGERGILRPGNISTPGVDAITADVSGGKARIFLNDFTDIDTPKKTKDSHVDWHKELLEAVAGNRLDFGDPAVNAAVLKAIQDGEVYVRTVRVDSTPKSNRTVTVGTPEKLELGQ